MPGKEFRDREYCELVYVNKTQEKYDCVDSLNQLNSGVEAKDICEQDLSSGKKESKICNIYTTIELFESKDPVKKGLDYCYFKYPWID